MFTETIDNFTDWRSKARRLLLQDVPPDQIIWQTEMHLQNNLLAGVESSAADAPGKKNNIAREFLQLAQAVGCHRHLKKWDMLYQALWRITHGEKHLLKISSDPLVHTLNNLYKAVRRDAHKMKAFVRFRCVQKDAEDFYIAWYKPDHDIARLVAPFFKRRFSVMKWTIMTPDKTVTWDGEDLEFSPGISNVENIEDNIENLWLTYYGAIFNPARIKIKAMKNEMPIRFWHGLPEAAIIPRILQEAPARVAKMMKEQEGSNISAANFLPGDRSLESLRNAAQVCEGCQLYRCARQTVFGKGSSKAKLMIVGEQPGLEEDIKGEPFVGPAGQVLRDVLGQLSIVADDIYITNSVKHFKNEVVRGRQMHRSPSPLEVAACKPWLLTEIDVIKPELVVCLGVTAAKALINPGFTMKRDHGQWQDKNGYQISATYHPSAILRAPTAEMKSDLMASFVNDLEYVAKLLHK